MAETRESIEQEFQGRMEAAVREAEAASERAAESRLQQAVDDVRENTRKQVTEELQALSQSH
jgi:hypothetical protein